LNVENFYLSSLTPIESWQAMDNETLPSESINLKTAEQIKSERLFSQPMSDTNSDLGRRA